MVFQAEDRARTKKQRTEAAIQLALDGRWNEAAQLNQAIIELFPTDVDAYNRLGKAMTELGRYAEAREAYQKALEIDPLSSIARKNLSRLSTLGEGAAPRPASQKLSPQMFIDETGKSGVTILIKPRMDVAARMTAGDQVDLVRDNGTLVAKSPQGELVGEIEPRLGQRLARLIDGGNQYVAAISGLGEDDVKMFIRETFQHPSQFGKLSFPPAVSEGFRPYVKERLVRKDSQEDTYYESDESEDWGSSRDAEEAEVKTAKFGVTLGADDDTEIDEEDE